MSRQPYLFSSGTRRLAMTCDHEVLGGGVKVAADRFGTSWMVSVGTEEA